MTSEHFGSKLLHSKSTKVSCITKRSTDAQCGTIRRQRVLITLEEKNRIMRACHDGVDGSHFGCDKTLSKVSTKEEYYVHEDVIKVINLYCDFFGDTIILLEVNGQGCGRVLQML